MKILLLTAEPPLPLGHVSARWFYVLVEAIAKAGHQVNILSSCSKAEEIHASKELFAGRENIRFFGFSTGKSKGIQGKIKSFLKPGSYQFSEEYLKCFDQLAKECDLIHGEQLVTGYVAQRAPSIPTIINVHNLIELDRQSEKFQNLYESLVHWRSVKAEQNLVKNFACLGAVSQELLDHLKSIRPKGEKHWIPFAIDSKFYRPKEGEREFHLGLVGNMNWRPSFSAALNVIKKIWPEVHKQRPQAKLLIAGWNAKTRLAEFESTPGLTIKENVKDIREIFQQIGSLIYFPREGSGIKVKILEALLMECAVVTNKIGLEGLMTSSEESILLGNNLTEIIRLSLEMIDNPERRKKLAQAGRQYVLDQHASQLSFQKLETIYKSLL